MTWTDEDDREAAKEGWGFFECSGDHPPIELERIDFPGEGETQLADDPAAWHLVLGNDTPLHRKALAYMTQESPEELAYITQWVNDHSAG